MRKLSPELLESHKESKIEDVDEKMKTIFKTDPIGENLAEGNLSATENTLVGREIKPRSSSKVFTMQMNEKKKAVVELPDYFLVRGEERHFSSSVKKNCVARVLTVGTLWKKIGRRGENVAESEELKGIRKEKCFAFAEDALNGDVKPLVPTNKVFVFVLSDNTENRVESLKVLKNRVEEKCDFRVRMDKYQLIVSERGGKVPMERRMNGFEMARSLKDTIEGAKVSNVIVEPEIIDPSVVVLECLV